MYIYMSYIYIYMCVFTFFNCQALFRRLCSVRMGGGAHGILLIRSDALELVQRVVPELRRGEEEARLQDLPTVGNDAHQGCEKMAAIISYKNLKMIKHGLNFGGEC